MHTSGQRNDDHCRSWKNIVVAQVCTPLQVLTVLPVEAEAVQSIHTS